MAHRRTDTNGSDVLRNRLSMPSSGWLSNQLKISDLEFGERIGVGGPGVTVWRAKKHGVQDVAVKKIEKCTIDDFRSIEKEVDAMERVKGQNVMQCYGVLEDETHYMIVMELCERGSLMDLLKQARDQPEVAEKLSWPVRLDIAHRIASGMALIHAESVLHRDLKSPNVLLTGRRDMEVKVADFGFSRMCDSINQYASMTSPMNLRWLAPEIAQPDPQEYATRWTSQADIYSFGVILWELLTFQFPFSNLDNIQLLVKLSKDGALRFEIPPKDKIPNGTFPGIDEYIQLMNECLEPTPQQRPESFRKIMDRLKHMLDDFAGSTTMIMAPTHVPRAPQPRAQPHVPTTPLKPPPIAGQSSTMPPQPTSTSPFVAGMGPAPSALPAATQGPPGGAGAAFGGPGSSQSPFATSESAAEALSGVVPGGGGGGPSLHEEQGSAGPLEMIGSQIPIDLPQPSISYNDHIVRFIEWFLSIDTDQDGLIDRQELAQAAAAGDDADDAVHNRGQYGRGHYIHRLMDEFYESDTNKDGHIDAYEFLTLTGRVLKEQQERRGHTFDLQVYEKEIKEAMAQANLQTTVADVNSTAIYSHIFNYYARWFRELDPGFTGTITLDAIDAFLRNPGRDPEVEKVDVFTHVKKRFTEFDTFRDGVLDKHEYMHLCAKLVTEAQQREGSTTFNEKHCRCMLYYFAMKEPEQAHVLFRKMQYNKLHVLGLQDDPGNFLRDAFVEIGTQIKGELVDDGTPFGIREFCAAFEQLDQRVQERYSQFGGRFARPVGPTV